ncbi:DUF1998 domain-containing protein [Halobacteria archaeon AArc-curdl1]|uniref:DUF1998 domain-containing protein n=1 Tax=Natronosalvus hydrolyticus TaxID=2979988 RepID=A0AAP2Z968_9EURY|nr:DUF1998 domain-containing protein [Halobacteria archaeon AArc-curdl1]
MDRELFEAFVDHTLKETVYQGVLDASDLDEEETNTFVKPALAEHGFITIVINDTSEGRSGTLHSLMDGTQFKQIIREAYTEFHGDSDDENCERACYKCLMSFYNQRETNCSTES